MLSVSKFMTLLPLAAVDLPQSAACSQFPHLAAGTTTIYRGVFRNEPLDVVSVLVRACRPERRGSEDSRPACRGVSRDVCDGLTPHRHVPAPIPHGRRHR